MTILDSRLRGNERKVKLIRNKTGPVRAKSCLKNKTGPLRARYSEPAWGAGDTSRGEQRLRTGRQTWEEHDSLATQRPRTMQSVLRAHNPAQHMPAMRSAEVPHGHLTRSYPRKRGPSANINSVWIPACAGNER